MAWYITHRAQYTNIEGLTTKIELETKAESDPGYKSDLKITPASRKVTFKFSNDYGLGVLVRQYKCTLINDSTIGGLANVVQWIKTNGFANIRLTITVSSKILFRGILDTETIDEPLVIFKKNPSTSVYNIPSLYPVNLTFSDAIGHYQNVSVSNLRTKIEASSNTFQGIENIPLADLLAEYIYEDLCGETGELVTAHNSELKYLNHLAEYEITPYFLRKIVLDLLPYPNEFSIYDIMKSICNLFNVVIGYSFTYDAIAVFDYLIMNSGAEPLSDGYEEIGTCTPHYLDKNAGNGLRTIRTTTMTCPYYNLTSVSQKTLKGAKTKFYPKTISEGINENVNSTKVLHATYNNDESASIGSIRNVSDVIIDTIHLYIYDNSNALANLNEIRIRPNWWMSEADPVTYYHSPFITAKSLAYLRFVDRRGIEVTTKGLVDPMLPIKLLLPNQGGIEVYRLVKGEYDILGLTTKMTTIPIGNFAQSHSAREVGVGFASWIYNGT